MAASTDRLGMFQYSCVLHSQAARALFVLGDWISAIDHGQRAVNAAEDADLTWPLSPLHSTMAQTHARMGAWALAEHHTGAALAAARQIADSSSVAYAHTAQAVLAHSRGDAAGVVAAVRSILAIINRDGTDSPGLLDWPVVHIEALITLGRHREAADRLDVFAQHVKRVDRPFPGAEAARMEGLLARAGNALDEAVAHLERASALADEASAPFEGARARLDLGRVLVDLDRSGEASDHVTSAMETFARLGAQPFVHEANDLLEVVGPAPSRWRSPPGAGLTPQEIAVSRLVRKGLSNREIAAELFLSTKTVEFHLRHVYMKLGITSRTQLVARSAELLDLRAADDLADGPLRAVQDE